MEINYRQTGIVILALAVVFFVVSLSFTLEVQKLNSFLHKDCDLPADVCPFNTSMPSQSVLAFTVSGLLAIAGLFMIFSKQPIANRNMIKLRTPLKTTAAKTATAKAAANLEPDEKKLFSMIAESGAVFQSEIVEKSGFSKVRVTRILDRLEGRGMVERKRRGMTNMVVLKH